METRPEFDLIWTDESFDTCPLCGEEIYAELVELVLIGQTRIREDVELGICSGCGARYGLIEDLLLALKDEGASIGSIERFQMDRRDTNTGVLLIEPIGTVPWDEFRHSAQGMDEQLGMAAPEPDEVAKLDELPEIWQVGYGIVDWIRDDDGHVDLSYVAVVVDGEGLVRHFDLNLGSPHSPRELARVVREATVRTPPDGQKGRPTAVLVGTSELARTLGEALQGTGIDVRVGETPDVEEALAAMAQQMRRTESPPFYSDHTPEQVRAYLSSAEGFFRAMPWERFSAMRFVAFRFDDDQEWAYLSLTGHLGEEYGFAVFEDWLQVCLVAHNPPSYSEYAPDEARHRPLYASGGLEQLTLEPVELLNPEDGHLLRSLEAKPVYAGQFPVARRFVPGPQQEDPFLGLEEYGVLMEALTRILKSRRTSRIVRFSQHAQVGALGVELRFPASGVEELLEKPGFFRLIIYGRRTGEEDEILQRRTRVEVDASGDLSVERLARLLREKLGARLELTAVLYQGFFLWTKDSGRGWPSPTLAHLARLGGVQVEVNYQPYTMRVLTMEPMDEGEIRISLRGSTA